MFCSIICAYKVTLSSNKSKHICSGSQTLHCTLAKYPEIKTNSNQVSQRWYVFNAFIVILCWPDYYTNCTGGTLGFKSRGWSNVFLGLKFSIPRFFLGRQIWQVYDFLWEGEGGWVFKTIWRFAVTENEVQPDLLRQGKSAWDLGPGTFGFCFSFFSFFRF